LSLALASVIKTIERQLVAHIGGNPSAVAGGLIGRALRLGTCVELLNEKALTAGAMSERNSRKVGMDHSLRRTLATLRLKATPPIQTSFPEPIGRECVFALGIAIMGS
jgi:hypothetical protein